MHGACNLFSLSTSFSRLSTSSSPCTLFICFLHKFQVLVRTFTLRDTKASRSHAQLGSWWRHSVLW